MGPYIPRRPKVWSPSDLEEQVREIVDQIDNRRRMTQRTNQMLHGGRWVGDDRYIQCTGDCDWRSEGPPGWSNNHLHLRQWNEHRVREAIRAGIPIEWRN